MFKVLTFILCRLKLARAEIKETETRQDYYINTVQMFSRFKAEKKTTKSWLSEKEIQGLKPQGDIGWGIGWGFDQMARFDHIDHCLITAAFTAPVRQFIWAILECSVNFTGFSVQMYRKINCHT